MPVTFDPNLGRFTEEDDDPFGPYSRAPVAYSYGSAPVAVEEDEPLLGTLVDRAGRDPYGFPEPEPDPFGPDLGGPSSLGLTAPTYYGPPQPPEPPEPPSSLDLTAGFGPDYQEDYGLPLPAGTTARDEAQVRAHEAATMTEDYDPLGRLGAGVEGAFGIAQMGTDIPAAALRSQGINPTESILSPFPALAGLARQARPDDMQERAQAEIARQQEGGRTLVQALAATEADRPEDFPGQKLLEGAVLDPLNLLPGIGVTDDVIRLLRAGKQVAPAALRQAGKAMADAAMETGMRAGEVQAGVARDLGLLPPLERGVTRAGRPGDLGPLDQTDMFGEPVDVPLSQQGMDLGVSNKALGQEPPQMRTIEGGEATMPEGGLPNVGPAPDRVPVDQIATNPAHQPRFELDEENVQRIIKEWDPNQLAPVEVRQLPDGTYELIHGHHRLEVARRMGLPDLPVRVLSVTPKEAIALARKANLSGKPLTTMETARLLGEMLSEGQSPAEIARALPGAGVRASEVEDMARLTILPKEIQEALDNPVLSKEKVTKGHAIKLAKAQEDYRMPLDEVQAFYREVILQGDFTAREVENLLSNFSKQVKEAATQGSMFGDDAFVGDYTGIMAALREAGKASKALEAQKRKLKGIISFIDEGDAPVELVAARPALERLVNDLTEQLSAAEARLAGQLRGEAPGGVSGDIPLEPGGPGGGGGVHAPGSSLPPEGPPAGATEPPVGSPGQPPRIPPEAPPAPPTGPEEGPMGWSERFARYQELKAAGLTDTEAVQRVEREAAERSGLPPVGDNQPLAPPPDVPRGPDREELGHTERARTEDALYSARFQAYMGEPANLEFYEILHNEDAFQQAAARMADDPDAARVRVMDLQRPRDPITVAENIMLIKQVDEVGEGVRAALKQAEDAATKARLAGDAEGATAADAEALVFRIELDAANRETQELTVALARYLNKAGQEVQLAAAIRKVSPAGVRLEIVKTVEAVKRAHGGEITDAMRAHLRQEEEAAVRDSAKRAAQKVLDDAAAEHARVLALRDQIRQELDELAGIKPGYVSFEVAESALLDILRPARLRARMGRRPPDVVAQLTKDALDPWRARAGDIAAMTDPVKKADAEKALLDEFRALKASERAKAMAPARKPGVSVEPAEAKGAEAPDGTPKRTAQQQRRFEYLTDPTKREVIPREVTADTRAYEPVKKMFDRLNRKMTDGQADDFLAEAAELKDRTDLGPSELREEIIGLVERQRQLLPTAEQARPFVPTGEWWKGQALRIEKLVEPGARQAYANLQSVESLAWARLQAAARQTDEALPLEMARDFALEARRLRDLPIDVQPQALDELVSRYKETEPLKTALAERKVKMDADLAARREMRREANELERLTQPHVAGGKIATPQQEALNGVVRILRKAEVWPDLEGAKAIRARIAALGGADMDAAVKALVEEVAQYDPVRIALAEKAAKKAREARLKQQLLDKDVLLGNIIPKAKERARNIERELINNFKRAKIEGGLDIPEAIIDNMMERSRIAGALPAGLQQYRMFREIQQDIKNLTPPSFWNKALDLYGVPRALKSTWDASYMFRQGALLGLRHPKTWATTWKPMLKSFRDPEFAEQYMDQLATRPLANLSHEAGLIFDEIYQGNEFFGSKAARKLPLVSGSERSFVVPGNKIRGESFDSVILDWLPRGWDLSANPVNSIADLTAITGKTDQQVKDLALLYNALSGKSNIRFLKEHGDVLGLAFWAPQWALSIPEAMARTAFSPGARAEGARVLAGYFGFVAGAALLGDVMGVWDAELDPRSSNFGKVRIAGTQQYYDPTLGMAGWLRMIAQMVPTPGPAGWKPYHKTASGNLQEIPFGSALGRFLRGKLNPVPGEFWSWAEGENIVGERRVFSGANAETAISILNTAKALFGPLTPVDIIEGIVDDGVRGGVLSLPNVVGMSGQSYSTFGDVQQKVTDGLFPGKQYKELDRADQRKVNDSAEIKAEIDKMSGYGEVRLPDKVRVRYDTWKEAKQRLEVGSPATETKPAVLGLKDYITAGMKGEALREKIQDFKRDSFKLAQALLTEDVLAASTQAKDIPLHDIYAQAWLNVPLDEDLATGALNYKKQAATRAELLLQAQDALKAAGKSADYITSRGEESYRGSAAVDPVVREALEAYDRDMEALRPYWEVPDRMAQQVGTWASAQRDHAAATAAGDTGTVKRIEAMLPWRLWQQAVDAEQKKLRGNKEMREAHDRWYPPWADPNARPERPQRPLRPLSRPERPARPLAAAGAR